ncbi:mechanosensitive ion channel domain-containing protein [Mucilaginibacter sp.]|uniref:mechanosensitive ion channel family protein n=1 Tax=Mucilaginibacter sp. TaxID=1882438 RepID=UPI0025DE40AC|nr:mechanosensitive ion channel domain-containing protein [Mucilaginibacter sp.]
MTELKFLPFYLISLCCLSGLSLRAQQPDIPKRKPDSVKLDYVARMQAFAKREAQESVNDFNADKATLDQKKALEEIKKNTQKAKIFLKHGVDTAGVLADLKLIDEDFKTAGDGVFTNKGTAQTFRNLTATGNILNELLNKALARKAKLDLYQYQLNTYRYELDSLLGAPSIFKFPKDSVGISKYMRQLVVVAYEAHPVDSVLKQASGNVLVLLNDVNLTIFKLQSNLDEIAHSQKELAENTFDREFPNIWTTDVSSRPFKDILKQAGRKASLTFVFFVENNKGKLSLLLLLIFTSFIYLNSLKNIYLENGLITPDFNGQLVLRYPIISAILIVTNLYQFFFYSEPFIAGVIFYIISGVFLTVLFRGYINAYWMKVWLVMLVLFVLSSLDNLILQASRSERWFLLLTAAVGFVYSVNILRTGQKEKLREKWIIYAIGLGAALEFGSILANIFGRYNLAKSMMIGGYMNVVIAIIFLWIVRLINEGLFLAYNVYTKQDKKLFYLNFEKVGQRAPTLLYVLMVIGWLVLFGRNFLAFESFAGPLRDFFSAERTLGDYTFTIINLTLFVAIMGTAVIISHIVSFFAADHGQKTDHMEKTGIQRVGSWLLLIRISILSIGLFLALAASGIPIDKLTIVLGALGVGIGFGLQTLVNNLVSGLIIAFEKPVNVGDVVDIGGQGGTMKSIGFRSSIISTWDGADLIMPNGDLLSTHLTNWTLAGGHKRSVIVVGIAYDADLQKVRQVVTDILEAEERLAKHPAYLIQYDQFSSSAIDLHIYFWVKILSESNAVKSDLIMILTEAFRVNQIQIPFQQHDIYIHDKNSPDSH